LHSPFIPLPAVPSPLPYLAGRRTPPIRTPFVLSKVVMQPGLALPPRQASAPLCSFPPSMLARIGCFASPLLATHHQEKFLKGYTPNPFLMRSFERGPPFSRLLRDFSSFYNDPRLPTPLPLPWDRFFVYTPHLLSPALRLAIFLTRPSSPPQPSTLFPIPRCLAESRRPACLLPPFPRPE